MSLNYDLKKVKDLEALWVTDADGDKCMDAVTNVLTFYTMFVGLNEITDDNYAEFYRRCLVYDRVTGGALLIDAASRESRSVTLAEIHRRIGLRTNASSMTKAKFRSHVMEVMDTEFKRKLKADLAALQLTLQADDVHAARDSKRTLKADK